MTLTSGECLFVDAVLKCEHFIQRVLNKHNALLVFSMTVTSQPTRTRRRWWWNSGRKCSNRSTWPRPKEKERFVEVRSCQKFCFVNALKDTHLNLTRLDRPTRLCSAWLDLTWHTAPSGQNTFLRLDQSSRSPYLSPLLESWQQPEQRALRFSMWQPDNILTDEKN